MIARVLVGGNGWGSLGAVIRENRGFRGQARRSRSWLAQVWRFVDTTVSKTWPQSFSNSAALLVVHILPHATLQDVQQLQTSARWHTRQARLMARMRDPFAGGLAEKLSRDVRCCHTGRKRMGSGESPGLQNRRTASLMSSVRSTRTRFRQFVFRKMRAS